jgi:hypothetical protein
MVEPRSDKVQMLLDYFARYKGNAFYCRLNSIASEHSMPVDLRVKAALHAMGCAKQDDKIV